jgi:hypothetical protein
VWAEPEEAILKALTPVEVAKVWVALVRPLRDVIPEVAA